VLSKYIYLIIAAACLISGAFFSPYLIIAGICFGVCDTITRNLVSYHTNEASKQTLKDLIQDIALLKANDPMPFKEEIDKLKTQLSNVSLAQGLRPR